MFGVNIIDEFTFIIQRDLLLRLPGRYAVDGAAGCSQ